MPALKLDFCAATQSESWILDSSLGPALPRTPWDIPPLSGGILLVMSPSLFVSNRGIFGLLPSWDISCFLADSYRRCTLILSLILPNRCRTFLVRTFIYLIALSAFLSTMSIPICSLCSSLYFSITLNALNYWMDLLGLSLEISIVI